MEAVTYEGTLVELLLALAAVIVAAATLLVVYAARHRFDAYTRQLSNTEQSVTSLKSGQQQLEDAAAKSREASAQDIDQVRETLQKLAERYETDKQTQTDRVAKTASQLRAEVATVLEDQRTRLDGVVQLGADHDSRLDYLDQLAAEREPHLISLDRLAPDVTHSLDDLAAKVVRLREEAGQQAAALRALGDDSTSASARMAETLTGLSDQLLALTADVGLLDLHSRELRAQLRKWLAYSAQQTRTAPAMGVMPGFIQAKRRAADQILPCLYESLLTSANLDFVFREQTGAAGIFYYLVSRSPASEPAEQELGNLLTACKIQDANSELPGLAELRSLLLAIYVGGPATVRLGPLVVGHAAEGMFRGAIFTAGEAQILDVGEPLSSPMRYARRLSELPKDRVLDLAAWAASNS